MPTTWTRLTVGALTSCLVALAPAAPSSATPVQSPRALAATAAAAPASPSAQASRPWTTAVPVRAGSRRDGVRRARDGSLVSGTAIRSYPGVVMVDAQVPAGLAQGSGTTISADGRILTSYHVVQGARSITVVDPTARRRYRATVVRYDRTRDVALLKAVGARRMSVSRLSTTPVRRGAAVSAIGQGGGQGRLYRVGGRISAVDASVLVQPEGARRATLMRGLLVTTADVVPGYSGGPLVDSRGRVVGIDTAATEGARLDGYAVPIKDALRVAGRATTHKAPAGRRR